MDPISMTYYAAVCAALGAGAPRMPGLPMRLIVGALVGLVAAAALPLVRGMLAG